MTRSNIRTPYKGDTVYCKGRNGTTIVMGVVINVTWVELTNDYTVTIQKPRQIYPTTITDFKMWGNKHGWVVKRLPPKLVVNKDTPIKPKKKGKGK